MHHFYVDRYSDRNSLIHQVNACVKILSFFILVVSIILTPGDRFFAFFLYASFLAVLIALSGIPLRFILRRFLVIVPFVFVITVAIPFVHAYTSPDRGMILGYFSLFLGMIVKSSLSIISIILLINSTHFSDFLKGLERLRVPHLIIMILSFMYRYIYVVQDELMRMWQAKESRSLGTRKWLHIRVLANMVGVLFIRSYERAEMVYCAMCSRGYTGDMPKVRPAHVGRRDIVFLVTMVLALTTIHWLGGIP